MVQSKDKLSFPNASMIFMILSVFLQLMLFILLSYVKTSIIGSNSPFVLYDLYFPLYVKGIFWRFEFHRGGQKLVIPVSALSVFELSKI